MSPYGIEALEAVSPRISQLGQAGPAVAAPGFSNRMEQELVSLNTQLKAAEQGIQKLAAGTAENLHEVMLQLEQARLAMQVAAQVRSRVLEAYQDVMRMQV